MTAITRNTDTSAALRRKAEEFLRLAATARDPVAWSELKLLAERYLERASELDAQIAARAG